MPPKTQKRKCDISKLLITERKSKYVYIDRCIPGRKEVCDLIHYENYSPIELGKPKNVDIQATLKSIINDNETLKELLHKYSY